MEEDAGWGVRELLLLLAAIVVGGFIIYYIWKTGWPSMSNGLARIKEWVHMA
jgi:hypothetical protein